MDGTRKHEGNQLLKLAGDASRGIIGESDGAATGNKTEIEGACSSVVNHGGFSTDAFIETGIDGVQRHLLLSLLRWGRKRDIRELRRGLLALLQVLDEAA